MTNYTDSEKFLQAISKNWRGQTIFAHTPGGVWTQTRDLSSLDPASDCYWCPAAFPPGSARTKDKVIEVWALVVDDVGTKVPEAAAERLGPPTKVLLTSPGNYQWVYRLTTPVPAGEWEAFWLSAEARCGVKFDQNTKDASHVFRLPTGVNTKGPDGKLNGGGTFKILLVEESEAELDPASIPRSPGPGPSKKASGSGEKLSRERLAALVAMIPNDASMDDRNPWIGMAAGIKAQCENEADGFEIWDDWCKTWPGEGGRTYDEDETREAWKSLDDEKLKTGGGMLRARAEAASPGSFAAWVFDDGVVPPGPTKPAVAGITATPFKWVDLAKTAPRDWLYGDILLRKFISMTVAPGGVGKSSLVAVETLAQVTGKELLGDELPSGELRVWLWNLEDPYEETQKKILAAAKHYGILESEIGDRLFVDSGRDQRLVIASMGPSGPAIVRPVVEALVEQIRLRRIDVVVIDPFVSCHGVPENDNGAMDMVVKEWGRVAEEGNCAVHLVDHTRKAGADVEVSTESSRGAKAKTDAARVVRVVNRMTGADGKAWGIVDTWRYFNTFNDKANMAPPRARREWFRMESISAGNGGSAQQAFSVGAAATPKHGDSVGVAVKWAPPSAQALAGGANFQAVVKAMGTQRWRASAQAKDWVGNAVSQGCGLLRHSATDLVLIKDLIKRWISDGLMVEVSQLDENRKMKDYIEIAKSF